jgi:hypothetical protein
VQTSVVPLCQLIGRGLEGGTICCQVDFHPEYYQGVAFSTLDFCDCVVTQTGTNQSYETIHGNLGRLGSIWRVVIIHIPRQWDLQHFPGDCAKQISGPIPAMD